jgi:pyrroloquinoline quinone biosynthesis protein B
MRVRILGSAAGGGVPQWNCRCRVCEAARGRGGRALPRTQSSIAVRGDDGPWFIVNASPDLRQQLETLTVEPTDGMRGTPFAGVLLTDGEIDHTAGLLLLRESTAPLRLYSTPAVRDALTEPYPILPMLGRYCGVDWAPLEPGSQVALEGGLEVEAFDTGGDPPLYVGEAPGPSSVGLTLRANDGGSVTYAPALAAIDDALVARIAATDCAFVDGTFWSGDELVELGLDTRNAQAMGHAPLGGPDGSLAALASSRTRTVFVHVNNTNPILLEGSDERSLVEAIGAEVGYDGMEIEV